ncbi:hypothetical protein [Haloarcula sp. JP-L23]|uniref:hypothetical protein n=1 Tax=Haloarcula sp. JP-L23 TaxID=2716717 RepID=UPI00140EB7B2|nr:hypothetical protein G9465_09360 [Haloarcula sp. JP-L23]
MQQPTGDSSAPVDRALLWALAEVGPNSPTVAAARCPLSVESPRPRFVALAERDLIERVSHEPVYRITDDGQQLLAAGSGTPQSVTGD